MRVHRPAQGVGSKPTSALGLVPPSLRGIQTEPTRGTLPRPTLQEQPGRTETLPLGMAREDLKLRTGVARITYPHYSGVVKMTKQISGISAVLLCLFFSLVGVSSAQIAIPEKAPASDPQNGWWLDSVSILFDGTDVSGLGTRPRVTAFFQATHTDSAGSIFAVPGVGVTLEVSDSVSVWRIGSLEVRDGTTILDVLTNMAWSEGQASFRSPRFRHIKAARRHIPKRRAINCPHFHGMDPAWGVGK